MSGLETATSELLLSPGKEEKVTGGKVWRVGWVRNQFIAQFGNSGHSNLTSVGWCIVLLEYHSSSDAASALPLDGWVQLISKEARVVYPIDSSSLFNCVLEYYASVVPKNE